MSDNFPTPTEVAETYVKAVRSGDLKLLRSVFADDMEMVGYPHDELPTGRLFGGYAITEFYGKLLEDRGGADACFALCRPYRFRRLRLDP